MFPVIKSYCLRSVLPGNKSLKKLCSNCVLNACVSLTYPTPAPTPLSPLCLSVSVFLPLSLPLSCACVLSLSLSACLGPGLSLLFTAVISRPLCKQTSTWHVSSRSLRQATPPDPSLTVGSPACGPFEVSPRSVDNMGDNRKSGGEYSDLILSRKSYLLFSQVLPWTGAMYSF